jgi:hypothetical protein
MAHAPPASRPPRVLVLPPQPHPHSPHARARPSAACAHPHLPAPLPATSPTSTTTQGRARAAPAPLQPAAAPPRANRPLLGPPRRRPPAQSGAAAVRRPRPCGGALLGPAAPSPPTRHARCGSASQPYPSPLPACAARCGAPLHAQPADQSGPHHPPPTYCCPQHPPSAYRQPRLRACALLPSNARRWVSAPHIGPRGPLLGPRALTINNRLHPARARPSRRRAGRRARRAGPRAPSRAGPGLLPPCTAPALFLIHTASITLDDPWPPFLPLCVAPPRPRAPPARRPSGGRPSGAPLL